MSKQVRLRRGTTAQHSSFTGAQGEVTVDTDKKVVVVHDGSTAGGVPMFPSTGGTITGSVTSPQFYATGGSPGFLISNQGTVGARAEFHNTGGTFYLGIDNSSGGLAGPYTINYYYTGNYDQVWSIGSAEKMRLSTGGNLSTVGIVSSSRYQSTSSSDALPAYGVEAGSGIFNAGASTIGFSVGSSEKMRLTSTGLLVGTTSGNHHIFEKASSSDYSHSVINSSATSPYGQRILLSGVTGGTGVGFLSCQDNAERFAVRGNGNVENVNNSYGALSDAKLKRDVTDTGPKLSKVLAMRIVNYYLKADPTNTKFLGVIAQELREIFPGLVEKNIDYETVEVQPARTDIVTKTRQVICSEEIISEEIQLIDGQYRKVQITKTLEVPQFETVNLYNENGQQLFDDNDNPITHQVPVMEEYTEEVHYPAVTESRPTGEVTLSVKYSVLVPVLVKAMQEMHEDFNRRLQALEN